MNLEAPSNSPHSNHFQPNVQHRSISANGCGKLQCPVGTRCYFWRNLALKEYLIKLLQQLFQVVQCCFHYKETLAVMHTFCRELRPRYCTLCFHTYLNCPGRLVANCPWGLIATGKCLEVFELALCCILSSFFLGRIMPATFL